MAFRRGFKTEANDLAQEIRGELGIGVFDPIDVRQLASDLEIPIVDLSEFVSEAPAIGHLLTVEQSVFSAITVFCGSARTIVHNDAHAPVRQRSNLAHELAHALLQHPATPALDNRGCRLWNQDIEDEAEWFAGAILVPEPATIAIAKGRWTPASAAAHFGVSQNMIQYRMNTTAAYRRVNRGRAAARN